MSQNWGGKNGLKSKDLDSLTNGSYKTEVRRLHWEHGIQRIIDYRNGQAGKNLNAFALGPSNEQSDPEGSSALLKDTQPINRKIVSIFQATSSVVMETIQFSQLPILLQYKY